MAYKEKIEGTGIFHGEEHLAGQSVHSSDETLYNTLEQIIVTILVYLQI